MKRTEPKFPELTPQSSYQEPEVFVAAAGGAGQDPTNYLRKEDDLKPETPRKPTQFQMPEYFDRKPVYDPNEFRSFYPSTSQNYLPAKQGGK